LILRSMKGRRILWSWPTISLFRRSFSSSDIAAAAWPLRSNHSSNSSEELNTSGKRKLRRAQSSWRLFWSGVPVSRRRLRVSSYLSFLEIWLSSFLILCASSTIRYSHLNLSRWLRQIRQPSYVVTTTSNLPG
jgi:hypothetical protein